MSGPFNMQPDESIGSWYIRSLVPYVLIYAALGALTGVIVGFVLGRTGRQRHHVLPTLSALLMVAFVVNARTFGFPIRGSVFLLLLVPLALWLLAGLLFPKENPARSFVGSPWPAALMTLAPLALSRGDVIGMGRHVERHRRQSAHRHGPRSGAAGALARTFPGGLRRGNRKPS